VKILLFGGSGQLGHEITKRARDLNFEIASPVASEVNVTDRDQVLFLAERVKPEVILNSAAYTAVDKAEVEKDAAFRVNRDGAANTAEAAKATGARLIYVSTDYVFDGSLGRPLNETDPVNPLSVYGASKLAGEEEVARILGDAGLIVRTASLHGQKGMNFVHTMIKLFQELDVVKVVADQTMSPTWAGWLAEVLLDLVRSSSASGIIHASGDGQATWLEFAEAIYQRTAKAIGREGKVSLQPTTAAALNRPAKRPVHSPFDTSKLTRILGRRPITWQAGLEAHLAELKLLGPEGKSAAV
jgi:dTDP-4-dehydrorhamnose reductase